jgi:hypothetical protein
MDNPGVQIDDRSIRRGGEKARCRRGRSHRPPWSRPATSRTRARSVQSSLVRDRCHCATGSTRPSRRRR